MKDKEKQIQEMAQIICGRSKDDICIIDNTSCNSSCCWARNAEAIYNVGYRKHHKDSIVLSREEYEMLANQYKNLEIKYSNLCDNYRLCKDANETLKQNIILTCKETTEKILRDLYSEATSNVSETVELTTFQIEQLAKQFGVEIKE